MLYNPQLETFLTVANAGSFNKASEILFITPTAVIKQINHLENDVGASLFRRTHTGIFLTDAGQSLYHNAKDIIKLSNNASAAVRSFAEKDEDIIRIGTSLLTPTNEFFHFGKELRKLCPDIKFQLIPYDNNPETAQKVLSTLGTEIDVIAGYFDNELLKTRNCDGLVLYNAPIGVAVSSSHRLAGRKKLSVHNLFGENLLLMKQGWCDCIDNMRCDIKEKYPLINIKDFDFYDINIFNKCENSNDILTAVSEWKNVHPFLRMIPVDWEYTIPFGLFHSPDPSKSVAKFLSAAKKTAMQQI